MYCLRLFAALLVLAPLSLAQDQTPDDAWEIVIDSANRIALKDARFTTGTRRLGWTAGKETPAKDNGPLHLEFREEKAPMLKEDVITLIPLASLARLDYDHAKQLVRATVKQAEGKDVVLVGPTNYIAINKFHLAGTAQKTEIGGALQLQDGSIQTQALVHAGAKPAPAPTGRAATIIVHDKQKSQHKVFGLEALYRVGERQRLSNVLMFQKTGQLDLARMSALRNLPPATKKQVRSDEFEMTPIEGEKQKLTLLEKTQLDDNQAAALVGLVGKSSVGIKLFPIHTIAEIRWEK